MTGRAGILGQAGGLVELTISVRQRVWSSFGSYHLQGVIWFLFERILGIIVLTGRVAAVDWISWVVRFLIPCLDRNQIQELKQRSNECYCREVKEKAA
jgi:hypothetical protein